MIKASAIALTFTGLAQQMLPRTSNKAPLKGTGSKGRHRRGEAFLTAPPPSSFHGAHGAFAVRLRTAALQVDEDMSRPKGAMNSRSPGPRAANGDLEPRASQLIHHYITPAFINSQPTSWLLPYWHPPCSQASPAVHNNQFSMFPCQERCFSVARDLGEQLLVTAERAWLAGPVTQISTRQGAVGCLCLRASRAQQAQNQASQGHPGAKMESAGVAEGPKTGFSKILPLLPPQIRLT